MTHHRPYTPSRIPPTDPTELGANYGHLVYAVMHATKTAGHDTWATPLAGNIGLKVNSTRRLYLEAQQTSTEADLAAVTTHAELLARLAPRDSHQALVSMHTEVEARLTSRLHDATHLFQQKPICIHPGCIQNPAFTPPTCATATEPHDTTARELLADGTPAELALDYATTVYSIYDAISPALFEFSVDLRNEDAYTHHAERIHVADGNVHWLHLLGHCIPQLTHGQAQRVLADLLAHHRLRLDRLVHDNRHQLQPNPLARCDAADCDQLRFPAALAHLLKANQN